MSYALILPYFYLQVSEQSSIAGYFYKAWRSLMGNYLYPRAPENSHTTKSVDARTKITEAREKYLKQILEDEKEQHPNGKHDVLDGAIPTNSKGNLSIFKFIVYWKKKLQKCL